jgi:hypothetical protein
VKTPKRLKQCIAFATRILKAHKMLNYRSLLNCAAKARFGRGRSLSAEETVALANLMSEEPVASQAVAGSLQLATSLDDTSYFLSGTSKPDDKQIARKPPFADFALKPREVVRYVELCTRACFPAELWGSEDNLKTALAFASHLIEARRFEPASLANAMEGFKISACAWARLDKNQRPNQTESACQEALVQDFVFWWVESWLFQLLKVCLTLASMCRR